MHVLNIHTINTITKCVFVHFVFHWILNEFGHFYLVKLFNPLVNMDRLLRIMIYFTTSKETRLLSNEI